MRALVADADRERSARVVAACEAQGMQVGVVEEGALALQRSLAEPPDVLLCPLSLPMIQGDKLAEILRTNPRTTEVRFCFLLEDELDAPVGMDLRDRFVVAPWRSEDLADQIATLIGAERPLPDTGSGYEIQGDLAQMSLVDLLQVLHLNKKNGTVRVLPKGSDTGATVVLRRGEVVDAEVPAGKAVTVRGVKALFRLMGCCEGRFEFTALDRGGAPTIRSPTRALLLEGTRQTDEAERFRRMLPSPELGVRLSRAPGDLSPAGHPLTQDVLRVAQEGLSVQEIVDRVPLPDYQILRTLHGLLTRGILVADTFPGRPAEGGTQEESGNGLLGGSQAMRIRRWAATRRPAVVEHVRVPVVASDPGALKLMLEGLFAIPGVRSPAHEARPEVSPERLGPLADIPLGEGLVVRLLGVPVEERYRPIWRVAVHGMLGAIVVLTDPLAASLARTQGVRGRLVETGRPVLHVFVGSDSAPPDQGDLTLEGDLIALPTRDPEALESALRTLLSKLVP